MGRRHAHASVVSLILIALGVAASCAPPLSSPARAQIMTGRISGLVTDTTGHVMPAISVILAQETTGAQRETITDEGGFYVFTNVPVGSYAVRVTVAGFRPMTKTGHVLVADGRLTVDVRLEPGPLTEAITVTAAGELINRTSGEIARVVDRTQVEALALGARSSVQLFTIIPGAPLVTVDPIGQTTNGMGTQPINGNRGDANNLMVDGGFNLSQANLGELTSSVGLDFIQEVKLQTSNFSAEYGRQLGAAINIVTRSGTNELGGGVSQFFRHEALDARHPFASETDRLRLGHIGWTLGGPIRRGRVFFFGGQEWRRIRRDTTPVRRTLPTRAQRRGDFRDVPGALLHPGTQEPIADRDLSALITPEGRAIAAVYDAMEALAVSYVDQAIPNNAVFQPASEFDFRQDMARIDYQAADRHTFSARYLHDAVRLRDPFGSNIESSLPNAPTVRKRPTDGLLLSHAWVIAPSVMHESRVNFGWYRAHTFLQGDAWQRRTYGFSYPQIFDDGRYDNGIPDVVIAGYTGFKGPSATLWFDASDFTFNETLTVQHRRHTVKTGALIVRATNDQIGRATDLSTGAVVFDPVDHPQTTGHAFADALMGAFRTYTEQSAMPLVRFRLLSAEAFVSDHWRVSDRVGLEIGARYQRLRPLSATGDALSTFDPALYDPARAVTVNPDGTVVPGSGDPYNGMIRAGGGTRGRGGAANTSWEAVPAGVARTLWPAASRVAPRVSAAYALSRDGRTSLRGGFGVFYEMVRGDMTQRASANPPFLQVVQFEYGNLANPAYVADPRRAINPTPGAMPATATGVLGTIAAVDRHMQPPSSTSYSVGLQRELRHGLLVEAAYVGNAGRRLTWRPDINRVPFDTLAANAALPSDQRQSINALRPFKGYGSIRQYRAEARSNYNGLQLYASRRRGNLHATASYTWSKVLTDASMSTTDPEDLDDLVFNYGPATFDRRHVFVGTYTWRVPWLRDRGGMLGATFGGWELSGIIRLQSGPSLTVTANTAIGLRRADYPGGAIALPHDDRTSDRYFKMEAFARPPDDRRGTAGVGTVQGPGLQLWDMSMRKIMAVGRRVTLQLQVDAFNALNHTNYLDLNTEVTSPAFGSLSSAAPARSLQIGTRLSF